MTGFVLVMWTVWGVLALLLLFLKIFIGRLTQDEDDQLVLDATFDHVKAENDAIVAKVKKMEPVKRLVFWLLIAATVFVIGYYILDTVNQFK